MPGARATINLAALKRAHAKLLRDNAEAHTEALREAGEYAKQHVKTKSKFQRRSQTNSVKDATEYRIVRLHSGRLLKIWNEKKVDGYDVSAGLEHGTKPHTITARNAKALRFEVGGQVLFRVTVHHPGTKRYKFLFKAVNAAHRHVGPRLFRRLEAAARKF